MSIEQKTKIQKELNDTRRNFINEKGYLNKWALASFEYKRKELKTKGFDIVLNDATNMLELVAIYH